MKKIYAGVVFSLISSFAFAQAGQWVWLHGSGSPNTLGHYGTKGVANPANEPPSMYEPCEWTDKNGNFWMYGGLNTVNGACYADVWKFDPLLNEWTWMSGSGVANNSGNYGVQGVPSPTNQPPSLSWGVASWVDDLGNFWMFGGNNLYTGVRSDLWKYDLSTGEWTWMKGPGVPTAPGIYGIKGTPGIANYPRSRGESSAAWTDTAGDLWLFGGSGGSNDLWRFNIASNMWTWMKGDSIANYSGAFGTKGVESSLNNPPGDFLYSHWKDKTGNFWIFGRAYNGLLRYRPSTNNWTWMNGNSMNLPGDYGTKCLETAANNPPARTESRATWTDPDGNFWMFGGDEYNDLWMYRVSTNRWTWVSGSNMNNAPGSWGVKGVYNASNIPDGRWGSVAWRDNNCHLYLFGGSNNTYTLYYNDVWQYVIDTSCVGPVSCALALPVANFTASDTILCANDCINFTDLSMNAATWKWSFPGGLPASSTDQNPQAVCYLNAGIYNVSLIVSRSGISDTLTITNYLNIGPQPPTPVITQNNNILYCTADSAYISYQWYDSTALIPGATDTFLVVNHNGNYNVQVKNKFDCQVAVGINIVLGLESSFLNDINNSILLYPNPASMRLEINFLKFNKNEHTRFTITDLLGQSVFQSDLSNAQSEIDISFLPSGIYLATVINEKQRMVRRFAKQ